MIIYMAPAAHLALTFPSVHLAVTELGPLLGLGSRETVSSPDLTSTAWEAETPIREQL